MLSTETAGFLLHGQFRVELDRDRVSPRRDTPSRFRTELWDRGLGVWARSSPGGSEAAVAGALKLSAPDLWSELVPPGENFLSDS